MLPCTCTAASVGGTIGASAVPGHADKEGTIMPVICGPPVLAVGHQGGQIGFDSGQIQFGKFRCIVKIQVHRVRRGRILSEDLEI